MAKFSWITLFGGSCRIIRRDKLSSNFLAVICIQRTCISKKALSAMISLDMAYGSRDQHMLNQKQCSYFQNTVTLYFSWPLAALIFFFGPISPKYHLEGSLCYQVLVPSSYLHVLSILGYLLHKSLEWSGIVGFFFHFNGVIKQMKEGERI